MTAILFFKRFRNVLIEQIRRAKKAETQLAEVVEAVNALIESSEGVAGLHLNGDLAPWEELLAGGRFEEWLGILSSLPDTVKGQS